MSNSRRSFFGKLAVTIGAAAAAVVPSKLLGEEEIKKTVGQPTVSDAFPTVKDEPKYALSDLDCMEGFECVDGRCVPKSMCPKGHVEELTKGQGFRRGLYRREYLSKLDRLALEIPKKAVNSYESVDSDYIVKLINPYGKDVHGVALACPDGSIAQIGTMKACEVINMIGVPNPNGKVLWYLKKDGQPLQLVSKPDEFKNQIVYSTMNPHPKSVDEQIKENGYHGDNLKTNPYTGARASYGRLARDYQWQHNKGYGVVCKDVTTFPVLDE